LTYKHLLKILGNGYTPYIKVGYTQCVYLGVSANTMTAPFRHMTEFSIIMKMTKITLCQQDDLESELIKKEFNEDYPCHIYFICKRPRVIINPDKCKFQGNIMELNFSIQKGYDFQERILKLRGQSDCSNFKIHSKFPFTWFQVTVNGNEIINARSSLYYIKHLRNYDTEMDLELLYIGQSYGVNGARTSPDRLKEHKTLQKIYSEAIQNNPDFDIWLNLLSFERIMITSFDGINKYPEENRDTDIKSISTAMNKFMTNNLNEQQIINFTEASLIKYFKPKYNIEYKDKFPNPAHKSYSECYDLNVNSVCFELETDVIYTRLFTKEMKPAFEHCGSFTMETRSKRISMFDILDNSIQNDHINIKIE